MIQKSNLHFLPLPKLASHLTSQERAAFFVWTLIVLLTAWLYTASILSVLYLSASPVKYPFWEWVTMVAVILPVGIAFTLPNIVDLIVPIEFDIGKITRCFMLLLWAAPGAALLIAVPSLRESATSLFVAVFLSGLVLPGLTPFCRYFKNLNSGTNRAIHSPE